MNDTKIKLSAGAIILAAYKKTQIKEYLDTNN